MLPWSSAASRVEAGRTKSVQSGGLARRGPTASVDCTFPESEWGLSPPHVEGTKKNKINKKGCSRFISESSIRWERRGRVGDVATASCHQICLSPMSPATLTDEGVTKNRRAHPASTVGVRTSTPGGTCLENALARATFHKSRVDATRLCLGHRDPDVSTRI